MSYDFKKKANSTSFKPVPRIKKACKSCNKEFETTSKNRKVHCSIKCLNVHTAKKRSESDSKKNRIVELYNKGVKYKDIAQELGIHQGTVCSIMNKVLYRNRRIGVSATPSKCRSVYKECHICGFSRIVEMAHIKPAHQGGTYDLDNIIGLCPNHHHLFDNKRLTEEEAILLKDRVPNYIEYIKKPKFRKQLMFRSVDLKTSETIIYTSMELNKTDFDRTVIHKCINGTFKQAYGKTWQKYYIEVEID